MKCYRQYKLLSVVMAVWKKPRSNTIKALYDDLSIVICESVYLKCVPSLHWATTTGEIKIICNMAIGKKHHPMANCEHSGEIKIMCNMAIGKKHHQMANCEHLPVVFGKSRKSCVLLALLIAIVWVIYTASQNNEQQYMPDLYYFAKLTTDTRWTFDVCCRNFTEKTP